MVMANGNRARCGRETRLSGRDEVVKARCEHAFGAQARDLGRGLQVGSLILEDVDVQDIAGDSDTGNTGPEPRQFF